MIKRVDSALGARAPSPAQRAKLEQLSQTIAFLRMKELTAEQFFQTSRGEEICSRFALNAGEGARVPSVQVRLEVKCEEMLSDFARLEKPWNH